jgi:hypothetical protein
MTKTFGKPAFAGTRFEFLSFGFASDFEIRIYFLRRIIYTKKILREGY